MRRAHLFVGLGLVAGCSYGPPPEQATPCSTASAQRLEARRQLQAGELANALGSIEAANAACPASRNTTRGEEVKLLAELGRCADARTLAAAIDADGERSDGAWLAASTALGTCERDATRAPELEALLARARSASAAGDEAAARTAWDLALARARAGGLPIVADCTRWSHKSSYVGAWLPPLDAFVLVDGTRALALRASDGHELRSFDAGGDILFVAASSDGRTFAAATAHEVVTWSIERAAPVARWPGSGPIAISPDGAKVLYVEGSSLRVHGDTRLAIPLRDEATGVHLGADAIAYVAGDGLHVLDASGKEQWHQPDLSGAIVGYRGGAYYVQSGSELGYLGFRVTRTRKDQLGESLSQAIAIDAEAPRFVGEKWIDDGNGASHGTSVIFDEATGKQTELHLREYRAFMARGRVVNLDLTDDISIFDATTGALQRRIASPSAKLGEVHVSEDGSTLIFGYILELLSFQTWSVAFSAAGAARLSPTRAWASALTADGSVALGPRSNELLLWSTRSGQLIGKTKLEPTIDTQLTPSISPSHRWLAAKVKDGPAWERWDLTHVLPTAPLPSSFLRFEDDDAIVVDDLGPTALDPVTLAPLKNRRPAPSADGLRMCRNGITTDCIDVTQIGDGPATKRELSWVDAKGEHTPFPGRAGHSPGPWPYAPADGRWVALSYADGALTLHPPHGGPGVELRVFPDGSGAYARSAEGHVELFGEARERAVCRIGAFSEPIEACAALLGPVVTPLLRPAKLTP